MIGIKKFLKGKKNIFDIGCGDHGSSWWNDIDKDAQIIGIETAFFPKSLPKNVKVYKFDANLLTRLNSKSKIPRLNTSFTKLIRGQFIAEKIDWTCSFDIVVANHVLEHVESPEDVIKGIGKIIKKNGIIYIGFPDGKNFTDVFYHLIHAEGGGHIQKLSKNQVIGWFNKYGFNLIGCADWPDDWLWFEKLYDFRGRGIKYINQKEISYLANVFRKELTPNRGYFYGWEMVFRKI